MWYVLKRLSNWNFIAYTQCTAGKVISGFYSLLWFTNYENIYSEFLLFHNTYSNFFFNDYDVTTLKIIHPITFRIIQSNQSRCCKIKITHVNLQPFHITISRTPSEYFCTECKIFLRYKANNLFLVFNHTKESVPSKNTVRLLNKTVNKI